MKKLLLALMIMVGTIVPVMAEETAGAYFHIGQLEFTYPLANTSVITLYDFWKGEGLLGAETRLASFPRDNYIVLNRFRIPANTFNVNFGAATSFIANAMPFVSIDANFALLIPNAPILLANVGLWFGHDFKNNDNRAGVKASKKF